MSRFHELLDDFLRRPNDAATEQELQQIVQGDDRRLAQLTEQSRLDRMLRDRGDNEALVRRIMATANRRRRRRRVARAAALVAAALLLALAWPLVTRGSTPAWGRVVALDGAGAWLERTGRRQPLGLDEQLLPGDEIDATAAAGLTLIDDRGARLTLVGRLALAADDQAVAARLRHGQVAVQLDSADLLAPWRLATPHALCTVGGTRFTVQVAADGSQVLVSEGTVRVERLRDGWRRSVLAGEQLTIVADATAPASATPVDQSEPDSAEPLPLDQALVAHWRFDDGSGAPLTDSGPHGIAATVPPRAQWTEGIAGKALLLDGRTAMSVAYHEALEPATGTVCFWLRPDRLFSAQCDALPGHLPHCLWTNLDWSGGRGYEICHPAHNDSHQWGLRLGHGIEGDAGQHRSSHAYSDSEPAPIGEWVHVAASWDTERSRLYLDGRLLVETRLASPPQIASGKAIHGFGYWQGAVDELRVYSRVLGQAELSGLIARPGE